MFDFKEEICSHMPFIAYGEAPYFEPKAFCCLMLNGKWKLHHFYNGKWERVNTRLPDDATECSPTAEWKGDKWRLSFIAGGFGDDRRYYLYRIDDLNNPIAEKVCLADVGFIWKNQIVYATRGGELSISGVRGTKNFHFNDVEWLYRVSYNPDNPHELLISGQKKGGYIFSWIFNPSKKYLYDLSDNGDVAYKAALFNGKCYYAKRGNGGFEDRHIVMAQNLRISELSYDDIVGNSQEANSPSMLKMLQNFTSATFRWASAGFKIADDETLAKRQAICDTCQYWKASARLGMGKCLKCGCTSLKLKFDTESCPTGKW